MGLKAMYVLYRIVLNQGLVLFGENQYKNPFKKWANKVF